MYRYSRCNNRIYPATPVDSQESSGCVCHPPAFAFKGSAPPRLRGGEIQFFMQGLRPCTPFTVIPAQAGIQTTHNQQTNSQNKKNNKQQPAAYHATTQLLGFPKPTTPHTDYTQTVYILYSHSLLTLHNDKARLTHVDTIYRIYQGSDFASCGSPRLRHHRVQFSGDEDTEPSRPPYA